MGDRRTAHDQKVHIDISQEIGVCQIVGSGHEAKAVEGFGIGSAVPAQHMGVRPIAF